MPASSARPRFCARSRSRVRCASTASAVPRTSRSTAMVIGPMTGTSNRKSCWGRHTLTTTTPSQLPPSPHRGVGPLDRFDREDRAVLYHHRLPDLHVRQGACDLPTESNVLPFPIRRSPPGQDPLFDQDPSQKPGTLEEGDPGALELLGYRFHDGIAPAILQAQIE